MAHLNLSKFGEEFKEYPYKTELEKWILVHDYKELWRAQPTYLISQVVYIIGALLTLLHALSKGGRWPWLWISTVLHGMAVELICFVLPDVDNYWHSQTPIIFFNARLPLHILILYPVFIYNASYAVSKLKLPKWSEPFAVGLTVVLIDIPYDIVAVKFLHWTWHDTDPNIGDRHYWVPWNSYYFHATFAASFTFWFHSLRRWIAPTAEQWKRSTFLRELQSSLLTACLGFPGGIIMFTLIYHPLHDIFKIHSEVTFFILITVFLVLSWSGDKIHKEKDNERKSFMDWMVILHLIVHYLCYLSFVIWFNPESEVSIGYHETIGPCDQKVKLNTAFGMVLEKRKYLCINDYDEDYFDFSCLPNGKQPKDGASWYTACGTPFRNRAEYIAVLSAIIVAASGVFYNMYFRSGKPTETAVQTKSAKKKKTN